jgi:hypothetical protein
VLPSGYVKIAMENHGKPPFLMGRSTISMAIFNSYVKLPEDIQTVSKQFPNILQEDQNTSSHTSG